MIFTGTGSASNLTVDGQATLAPGVEVGLYSDILAIMLSY